MKLKDLYEQQHVINDSVYTKKLNSTMLVAIVNRTKVTASVAKAIRKHMREMA